MRYLCFLFELVDFIVISIIKYNKNYYDNFLNNSIIGLIVCKAVNLSIQYESIYTFKCTIFAIYLSLNMLTITWLSEDSPGYSVSKYLIVCGTSIDIVCIRFYYCFLNNVYNDDNREVFIPKIYDIFRLLKIYFSNINYNCNFLYICKKKEYPEILENGEQTISKTPSKKQIESPRKCAICIENVKLDKITTNCRHTYCRECIQNWIKVKNICPLCKQKYPLCKNRINV